MHIVWLLPKIVIYNRVKCTFKCKLCTSLYIVGWKRRKKMVNSDEYSDRDLLQPKKVVVDFFYYYYLLAMLIKMILQICCGYKIKKNLKECLIKKTSNLREISDSIIFFKWSSCCFQLKRLKAKNNRSHKGKKGEHEL